MDRFNGLLNDRRFLIVVASSVFCVSGVNLLSPALPAIATGLSVSDARIGLLITAFTLPTVFITPVSGFLADTAGRNRVMATGSLLMGIGGLASFYAPGFNALLTARIVQGAGFACVMPATVALLGDFYSYGRETTAQGLRTSFNKVGGLVWTVLGGILAGLGWRNVFLVYLVMIPLAVAIYRGIPSTASTSSRPREYIHDLRAVASVPRIRLYLSIGFVRMFVRYSLLAFLPLLLVRRFGAASSEVGVYLGLLSLGGIVTSAGAGAINARYRKTSSVFISLLVIGAGCLIIALTGHLGVVLACIFGIGLADAALSPLHKSLLTQNVEQEHRGGTVALNSTLQNIGKTLGPASMGLLVVYGLGTVFVALAAAGIGSSLLYFRLRTALQQRDLHP
ncbi:MAG: MFS transporter [Candidatus Nanohaloarchaea archaeon]|nr:MFS transporter [Candidatus Nanohaloarchaea archaeon]